MFQNKTDWEIPEGYYLPKAEIKYYNVMIDGRNFCDQSVNHNLGTYENIRKIATGQGDDYTIGCLLDLYISQIVIR